MTKKRVTLHGTVEYSEWGDEVFAETVLLSSSGTSFLLDSRRMSTDPLEWVGVEVKVSGWIYKKDGRTYIDVAELEELFSTFEDDYDNGYDLLAQDDDF